MRTALHWAWIWAATYIVGGSLCLVAMASEMSGHSFGMSLPGFSLACLVGCGLLAFVTKGRSIREGVVAASMVGVAQLFFGAGGVIGHVEVFELRASLGHPLSTAMVSVAGGVLGGRLGASLAALHTPLLLDRLSRVASAALILIGACFVHGVLIAIGEQLAPNFLTALCFVAVVATPSFAAAALQHTQRNAAEQSLAAGITAIILVIDALFLLEGYGLGLMCLCTLVLIFIGAAIYALALPGLMTVQAMSSWRQVDPLVPQAIALRDSESHASV